MSERMESKLTAPQVHGETAPGFEPVLDAFQAHLHEVGEGGVAFAVEQRGRMVVDLWAGRAGERPWERDTRAVLMSSTKGVVATAVASLVSDGTLEVDAPVANYWPEFAAGGKGKITVGQLMSHQAGLVTVPGYEELITDEGDGWEQTEEFVARLAAAEPLWEPGTAFSYHGVTYGWLTGELVRRASGKTTGEVLRERLTGPLRAEVDLGTPAENHPLVAPVILPGPMPAGFRTLADPDTFARMMLTVNGKNMVQLADPFFNRPEILAMELGHANVTASARGVARLYAPFANAGRDEATGRQLLTPEAVTTVTAERIGGADRLSGAERRWGLGFQLPAPASSMLDPESGPSPRSLGHDGFGGEMGFADPEYGASIGFVRSHLSWSDELYHALLKPAYRGLRA